MRRPRGLRRPAVPMSDAVGAGDRAAAAAGRGRGVGRRRCRRRLRPAALEDGRLRLLLLRARRRTGAGPGSGWPSSRDGVAGGGSLRRCSPCDDFGDLRHLALADVIRRARRDLAHAHGGHAGRALDDRAGALARRSDVGAPGTGAGPHRRGRRVGGRRRRQPEVPRARRTACSSWASTAPGRRPRASSSAMATSRDGAHWTVAGDGPVRCTTGDERRIESLFFTLDALGRPAAAGLLLPWRLSRRHARVERRRRRRRGPARRLAGARRGAARGSIAFVSSDGRLHALASAAEPAQPLIGPSGRSSSRRSARVRSAPAGDPGRVGWRSGWRRSA